MMYSPLDHDHRGFLGTLSLRCLRSLYRQNPPRILLAIDPEHTRELYFPPAVSVVNVVNVWESRNAVVRTKEETALALVVGAGQGT